ncbi:hypothetical protein WKS98_08835 [Lagierella sp. ICN-221743]
MKKKNIIISLLVLVVAAGIYYFAGQNNNNSSEISRISEILSLEENSKERYLKAKEVTKDIPDFKVGEEKENLDELEEELKAQYKDKDIKIGYRTLKEDISIPTEKSGDVNITMYSEVIVLENVTDNEVSIVDPGCQYIYGEKPFIEFRNGGFNINEQSGKSFRASATGEFIFDKSVGNVFGEESKGESSKSNVMTIAKVFKLD